jgi:hypothetical protein
MVAGDGNGRCAVGASPVAKLTTEAESPAPGLAGGVESATVQPRWADRCEAEWLLRVHGPPGAGDEAARAGLGCRSAELAMLVVAPTPSFAARRHHAIQIVAWRHAIEGECGRNRRWFQIDLTLQGCELAGSVTTAARGEGYQDRKRRAQFKRSERDKRRLHGNDHRHHASWAFDPCGVSPSLTAINGDGAKPSASARRAQEFLWKASSAAVVAAAVGEHAHLLRDVAA